MKDIAARVGVSTALVSYVLNGKEREARVGIEVAKKIKKIAKELNYQPNLIARGLKFGKTKTLGLIVADISNQFFATLARIIENEAGSRGYTVIIGSSDEKIDKSGKLIETMLSRQVDGLIIAPVDGSKTQIQNLRRKNIPVMLIDRSFSVKDLNVVTIDNQNASYEAVSLLIQNGYKKIGMIANNTTLIHMQDRIDGYKKALSDGGLKFDARLLKKVSYDNTALEVEQALAGILQNSWPLADAFLFATNSISVYALKYIRRLNISVPDQLGLICFDESDAYDFFYSPVTYINQNLEKIGKNVVQIIVDQIEQSQSPKSKRIVNATITIRQSCGSQPDAGSHNMKNNLVK